jgi:hypothetical protein
MLAKRRAFAHSHFCALEVASRYESVTGTHRCRMDLSLSKALPLLVAMVFVDGSVKGHPAYSFD